MKLRNRKTGEIAEFRYIQSDHVAPLVLTTYKNDKPEMYTYNSLAELNSEWEDVSEEPKEYWCIDWSSENGLGKFRYSDDDVDELNKSIGNYFETQEEAEKALEKLKAWKRLKDKGFRIDRWENDKEKYLGDFVIYAHTKDITDIVDDLDLLLGGEE